MAPLSATSNHQSFESIEIVIRGSYFYPPHSTWTWPYPVRNSFIEQKKTPISWGQMDSLTLTTSRYSRCFRWSPLLLSVTMARNGKVSMNVPFDANGVVSTISRWTSEGLASPSMVSSPRLTMPGISSRLMKSMVFEGSFIVSLGFWLWNWE